MHQRARALIEQLELQPHPEGGFFREIHRAAQLVKPLDDRPPRHAVTLIWFLLTEGTHSAWHRVLSDEIWHFHEGDPLQLRIASPELARMETMALNASGAPQAKVGIVPAEHWQAARCLGEYSLVACTVGPGFDFADFTLLRETALAARLPDPVDRQLL